MKFDREELKKQSKVSSIGLKVANDQVSSSSEFGRRSHLHDWFDVSVVEVWDLASVVG